MPRIWFDEDGTPMWECNDCGALVYLYDDLCRRCLREQMESEEAARYA